VLQIDEREQRAHQMQLIANETVAQIEQARPPGRALYYI
jgi:hypothetical protein